MSKNSMRIKKIVIATAAVVLFTFVAVNFFNRNAIEGLDTNISSVDMLKIASSSNDGDLEKALSSSKDWNKLDESMKILPLSLEINKFIIMYNKELKRILLFLKDSSNNINLSSDWTNLNSSISKIPRNSAFLLILDTSISKMYQAKRDPNIGSGCVIIIVNIQVSSIERNVIYLNSDPGRI